MNKQGDTTQIFLDYKYDGQNLEDYANDYFANIVLQLNSEGQTNALTFQLTDNTIQKDSGKYYVKLTQTQSMTLGRTIRFQLSVRVGTDVYSSDIGSMTVGELLRTSEVGDGNA